MRMLQGWFVWIYRGFALIGLGAVLLIGLFLARDLWHEFERPSSDAVAMSAGDGGTTQPRAMRIGDVIHIAGGDVKMLEVWPLPQRRSGRLSSSYEDASTPRNLIFVPGDSRSARWLFLDNDRLLPRIEQLCVCEVPGRGAPTLAIFLEVVRADSGGDGRLDDGDDRIPVLLRPDGTGYTELGKAVDRVLDVSIGADGARFGLLVEDEGRLLYREYGMDDFALRSEHVLATLSR